MVYEGTSGFATVARGRGDWDFVRVHKSVSVKDEEDGDDGELKFAPGMFRVDP